MVELVGVTTRQQGKYENQGKGYLHDMAEGGGGGSAVPCWQRVAGGWAPAHMPPSAQALGGWELSAVAAQQSGSVSLAVG